MGVAKVTGPREASHVSYSGALEKDMLWDHPLKHMVAIFTGGWGAGMEKVGIKEHKVEEEEGVLGGKMILGRGEGWMEEHIGAAGNSLPRSRSLLFIEMRVFEFDVNFEMSSRKLKSSEVKIPPVTS